MPSGGSSGPRRHLLVHQADDVGAGSSTLGSRYGDKQVSHRQSQGLECLLQDLGVGGVPGWSINHPELPKLPTQEDSSDSPQANPLEMGSISELLQLFHLPQKPPKPVRSSAQAPNDSG